MTVRSLQRGFAGGEIAPSMLARTDLPHYKMGAFRLDNFFVLPQGAVRARSGFRYIGTPLSPYQAVRLIPFRYSSTQTYALEFSNYKMRIISNGAYVLNEQETAIYEVTTPYSAENLKFLDYSQNADIVTITSNLYPPYELKRYTNTDWRFERVSLSPSISAPTISAVTAVYVSDSAMTDAEKKTKDKLTVTYVVTAVDANERESVASAQVTGHGNYYINGAKIRVRWGAVAGAVRYKVYRNVSGIFGYVGETEQLTLDDEGLNPNTSITPPKYKTIFADSNQQITSVEITNGGSGYHFGQIGQAVYLPRTVTLDAIQPFVSATGTQEQVETWELINPRVEFINGITTNVELSIPVTVSYAIKEHDNAYIKIAYLADEQLLTITNTKLAIHNCIVKFVCDNASTTKSYLGFAEQPADKQDNTKFNIFDTGLSFSEFLTAFPQETTVQIPLTISDQIGVNADIDVVCENGVASTIIVNSTGYSYSISTTATLDSSVGSGATFTVQTTGNTLPDYPSTCTQYDQRRVFAGSNPHPLKCWFTNAGQQDLMCYHLPVLDDDRIEIEAVTSDADRIKHAVALESLLLFTSTSELRVYTQNSDALTPKSVAVRAQSYVGANNVQPIVANNTIIYSASRGGHVRALGYDYTQSGYITQDISLRAPHLFDGKEIVSLTLAKSPVQIIWAVSSDGALLSCTYFPEQQLVAWAQHHTEGGKFEDVCAICEGQEDHVYAVVNRSDIRYIERLDNLMVGDKYSYRYLDSYLQNTFNSAVLTVNGLGHLEGKEVAVFVDGEQQSNKTVVNGAITLDKRGYNVAVGLPIKCTLITLPLIQQSEAELQGRTKNISEVYFRVSYDGNIKANSYPSNNLRPCKKEDIYMQSQDLDSYLVKVSVDGEWNEQGQLKMIHDDALPLEVQSLVINMSHEGGK